MIAETQKFLFERSFDTDQGSSSISEVKLEESPEIEVAILTFSEQDLAIAREEAFAEGKNEGLKNTEASTEQNLLETLENIATKLDIIKDNQDKDTKKSFEAAIQTATTIVKKCFPRMTIENGVNEIENMLKMVFSEITHETDIKIQVNPEIKLSLAARLEPIIESHKFTGNLSFKDNNDISIGDCRIKWDNGAAERNQKDLLSQVDRIIKSNFPSLTLDQDPNTKAELEHSNFNEGESIVNNQIEGEEKLTENDHSGTAVGNSNNDRSLDDPLNSATEDNSLPPEENTSIMSTELETTNRDEAENGNKSAELSDDSFVNDLNSTVR